MKITENVMVALQYELFGADNELIEQTKKGAPLEFVFGQGTMLEAFEEQLKGLKAGDTFDFKLEPAQAYGEFSKEAIQDLDIAIFQDEKGEINTEIIKEGNLVPLMTQDGHQLQAIVLEVTDTIVKMDFNHPLAGETLHFKGMVELVHEATEEELNPQHHSCGCGGEGHHHHHENEEHNEGGCGCHH